jgi:hypothetical protein
MIRHTILFKLKTDIPKREIERIFSDILGITSKFQGVAAITGGTCHYENLGQQVFSHGISIDFDDKATRDIFINDQLNWMPIVAQIANISEPGHTGFTSFDFR